MSPFDEGVHFDYVMEALEGGIVVEGDTTGQRAMRETACRGNDVGVPVPPCDQAGPFRAKQFPNLGYNSAYIHTPVYYYVTAGVTVALTALTPVDSPFVAARLAGAAWLWLGLLVLWRIGRELALPPAPMFIVLVLVASNPVVIHASSTVNNDATALLMGGAVVLTTLLWERGALPSWALAGMAFLAPAVKVSNAFAVGVCALYLATRWANQSHDRADSGRPPARGMALLAGGAGASVLIWMLIQGALGEDVLSPMDQMLAASGFDVKLWMAQLLTFVPPLYGGFPTSAIDNAGLLDVTGMTGVLILGACLAPVLTGRLEGRTERLAGAGALAIFVSPLLFFVTNYYLFGIEFDIPQRYGLSLVPALGAGLAGALRWRGAVVAVAAFAAVAASFTFVELLAAI
jgi:hypothetical protein